MNINPNIFKLRKVLKKMNTAISDTLRNPIVINAFKNNPSAFTRTSISTSHWSFVKVCVAILLRTSTTSSVLISKLKKSEILSRRVTSSSFRKARGNVNPTALYYAFFNANSVVLKYDGIASGYALNKPGKYDKLNFGKDLIYLAVDSTSVLVSDHPETIEYFGCHKNSHGETPIARISALYNIRSGVIIDIIICPYKFDERTLLSAHLMALKDYGIDPSKVVIIGDRGYPGKEIVNEIESYGYKFIIRCKENQDNIIKLVNKPDQIVDYSKFGKCKLRYRVICIKLSSGITEKIITNIYDAEATVDYFYAIYGDRWDLEVKFHFIKSIFGESGLKFTKKERVNAIMQIIYATAINSNFLAIEKLIKDIEIDEKEKTDRRIHEAQTNVAMLFHETKIEIVESIYFNNPDILIQAVEDSGVNSDMMVSIRNGRSYERYQYTIVKKLKGKRIMNTPQCYPQLSTA